MPLIPLSFLLSLLCVVLLIRLGRPQPRRWLLQLLLLICGWQSLLVGIRFGYQQPWVVLWQPLGAALIPPLCYLVLMLYARGPVGWRDIGHLLLPLLTLLAQWKALFALDGLIVVGYLGYGVAILGYLRRGENSLQQVALADSWLSYRLWCGLGGLLIISGFAELAIALDYALLAGHHAGALAAIGNVLVVVGVALVLGRGREQPEPIEPPVQTASVSVALDAEEGELWFQQINQRLLQDDLYLEPNLNLARLARKTGLPARKVSQAINQQAGMNVSQYVNQLRIQQAAEWLLGSERPITEVMRQAGFSTKSNFNREFLRVYGVNPSEWRKRNHQLVNASRL
ncbi:MULTISPECIES: AraC family transcriptional regulator [unclassified Serratia (in: enterobacteria)]|uniref:helix-turn-helix domain-containing protein n=1 Tax=unclassified Serratia (in: enterobacteria) TaxID=2647522 RepID=UPI00050467E1|nr:MULTISPECIES: AraC family transcriptional regulator [unclassified Serratia (in: enterobacteria)]KFK92313.1 AraC family transcriptional regulator [Serratia sp. Ag2]KFK96061.1 AraC family transcriptional regulator [Serratia sp. Ag1]